MPPSADDLDFARYRDHADAAALARVFDRTAPKLLLLASHWTRDPASAEDLVQITFVQALRDAAQWDQRLPLLKWLAGILAHRAMDARKREVLRAAAPLDAAVDVPATEPSPLDAAMDGEMLDRVTAAVDGLEEPYRGVLVLRLVHGLEPTAIAHALGRPPATVRKQLERGLQQLRGALPATLAVLLAGLVASGRGLAAVRTAVLTAGRCGAPAAGAAGAAGAVLATTGGVLVMNKLLVSGALAVLALGTLLWWSQIGGPVQAPAGSGQPRQPTPVAASLPKDEPAEAPVQRTVDNGRPAAAPATASLEVLVLDDKTSAPVPGIGIDLVPRDGREEELATLRQVTDAQGITRFAPLPSGPHHLTIDLGKRDVTDDVVLTAGQQAQVTLRISDLLTVHGQVVDDTGHPVPGARILRCRAPAPVLDFPPYQTAVADSAGEFDVVALPLGLMLQARDADHAPSPVYSVQAETLRAPLLLRLGATPASLHGTVSLAGKPVAGAQIRLLRPRASPTRADLGYVYAHSNAYARSDAAGAFGFSGLLPGAATVQVHSAGAAPAAMPVELRAGQGSEVTLVLQPTARIAGRVLDQDGAPLAGARLWCTSSRSAMAYSAGDGSFLFDCVSAGKLSISAGEVTGYCSRRQALEVAAGQTSTCDFHLERLPRLSGRVIDAAGRGLRGFLVTANRTDLGFRELRAMTDTAGRIDTQNGRSATTDGDGRFDIPVMPEVNYRLELAEGGGWFMIAGDRFGEFTAPRNDLVLTVQPEELATTFVQGRLLDVKGEAVTDAWFQVLEGRLIGAVGRGVPGTVHPAADGRFRIGPMPARSFALKITPGRTAMPPLETPVFTLQPGQTLDLGDLCPGATAKLSVRLRQQGGGVFAGALLGLDAGGGINREQIYLFDANGNLDQAIAAGHYTMVLYGDDVPTRRLPLDLGEGEHKQLEFTLPHGVRRELRLRLPEGESRGALQVHAEDGGLAFQSEFAASDEEVQLERPLPMILSPGAHRAEFTGSSGRRYTASFAVLEQPHEPGKSPTPCELLWQPAK